LFLGISRFLGLFFLLFAFKLFFFAFSSVQVPPVMFRLVMNRVLFSWTASPLGTLDASGLVGIPSSSLSQGPDLSLAGASETFFCPFFSSHDVGLFDFFLPFCRMLFLEVRVSFG